jgi:hypothetical protein
LGTIPTLLPFLLDYDALVFDKSGKLRGSLVRFANADFANDVACAPEPVFDKMRNKEVAREHSRKLTA